MSWEEMESSTGLTPAVPLRHLKTPPMIEAAKKAMREQGCDIVEDGEHCVVTFPEGRCEGKSSRASTMGGISSRYQMASR